MNDQGIGARVRAVRVAAGWTAQATAERAGISPVTWSRIENGKIQPNSRTVEKMARGLGVSVADLYGGGPMPTTPAAQTVALSGLPEPWMMLWRSLSTPEERRHFLEALATAPVASGPRPLEAMNCEEAAAELAPLVGATA